LEGENEAGENCFVDVRKGKRAKSIWQGLREGDLRHEKQNIDENHTRSDTSLHHFLLR
jgi:hypothetical protein